MDSLVCLSTVAEITDAINHLDEHMAEFYSNKEISTEDIDHDMVGDVQMPERYRDDANHYDSIIIDHDWMDEFKEVYARTIGVRVRVFETYERLLSPRSTRSSRT
jgi:hypothetical protein